MKRQSLLLPRYKMEIIRVAKAPSRPRPCILTTIIVHELFFRKLETLCLPYDILVVSSTGREIVRRGNGELVDAGAFGPGPGGARIARTGAVGDDGIVIRQRFRGHPVLDPGYGAAEEVGEERSDGGDAGANLLFR